METLASLLLMSKYLVLTKVSLVLIRNFITHLITKIMEITAAEFTRLANNFYNANNVVTDIQRISLDSHLFNYINGNVGKLPRFRVAFCWICLNPPYWEYAKPMIDGAKQFFLPGHQVDYFLWSDMPSENRDLKHLKKKEQNAFADGFNEALTVLEKPTALGATLFPTEAVQWPLPTLMRYHLFLQQEEVLKDYDYIFYCDVDMQFVNVVGDEILGKGLTAALHPGYAIRKEYWPPYEPNKQSASFISRPGMVTNDQGKPRFMPMYFAGGLQGGTSQEWFKAMRAMKALVDRDMNQNYTPIWNDETAWNKYLEKTPEDLVVLTPSYIYPDSLIKEYYEPLWGCSYVPKLITLTKKFSTSKEGGEAVARMIQK